MNLNSFSPDSRTKTRALPIQKQGSNGKAVLLRHGYIGHTAGMAYLCDRLHEGGFTVLVPRLSGHGTDGKDLLQSTWKDWVRKTIDAYLDLRARCESVHIVGFSMGALLCIILASIFKVGKIVLIAPAVLTSSKIILLTPLLRPFMKSFIIPESKREKPDNKEDPDSISLYEEYSCRAWVGPAYQLYRLQMISRRRVSRVTADALIIGSEADTVVPLEAGEFIYRRIASTCKKRVVLKRSPHLIVNGPEQEQVAREIIAWLCGERNHHLPDFSNSGLG